MNRKCSILVLYEDEASRQHAIGCIDLLVRKELRSWGFETAWASFEDLKGPKLATEMMRKASGSDFVVFAMPAEGNFSFATLQWIERWLSSRENNREGALVGLIADRPAGEYRLEKELFLRNVAREVGFDYLTRLPDGIVDRCAIPDSLNSYSERASQVTGVLDEILQHPGSPPQLAGSLKLVRV